MWAGWLHLRIPENTHRCHFNYQDYQLDLQYYFECRRRYHPEQPWSLSSHDEMQTRCQHLYSDYHLLNNCRERSPRLVV